MKIFIFAEALKILASKDSIFALFPRFGLSQVFPPLKINHREEGKNIKTAFFRLT